MGLFGIRFDRWECFFIIHKLLGERNTRFDIRLG